MLVFNPDPFLLPTYRLSPFVTEAVSINSNLPADDYSVNYFNSRFGENNWAITLNGREAIHSALKTYNLKKDDLVTILTTSENFYISSCVTKEIGNFCQWNREIVPETKIIFVNHEFGYPYSDMEKLVKTGLPIIEDCCTTFFSQDEQKKIGSYGDFALYSFPKFFPIQIGGIIVSNKPELIKHETKLKREELNYINNVISFYLRDISSLLKKREDNFKYALSLYKEIGFQERFEKNNAILPSSLMLKNNGIITDLPSLKVHLINHGIFSSVFYGEDSFFVPCHQNMTKFDIDYIFQSVINFKHQYDNK